MLFIFFLDSFNQFKFIMFTSPLLHMLTRSSSPLRAEGIEDLEFTSKTPSENKKPSYEQSLLKISQPTLKNFHNLKPSILNLKKKHALKK
jgi:uncharacterized protein YggT (Ycf19 family)